MRAAGWEEQEAIRAEEESKQLVGAHWRDLGFQNDNPTSDLRGAGVLGLQQMMYADYLRILAVDSQVISVVDPCVVVIRYLAQRFSGLLCEMLSTTGLKSSLAIALINITGAVLEASSVKQGVLAGRLLRCELGRPADDSLNAFYVGACARLLAEWREKTPSIMEFEQTLSFVKAEAFEAPRELLR